MTLLLDPPVKGTGALQDSNGTDSDQAFAADSSTAEIPISTDPGLSGEDQCQDSQFAIPAVNVDKELLELKEFLYDARRIMERDPATWGWAELRFLVSHKARAEKYPDSYSPAVKDFIVRHAGSAIDALRGTKAKENGDFDPEQALQFIHTASQLLSESISTPRRKMELHTIGLEQICELSDRLRLVDGELPGARNLEVRSVTRDEWFAFPVPNSGDLVHKGGFPRVVLKIIAGASEEMIEAELPPNDFDVIVDKESAPALAECAVLGIEKEGIEFPHEFSLPGLAASRDIDLNSCFMTNAGLVYTQEAFVAARSGEIRLFTSLERALYGIDFFIHDGLTMVKDRGMTRLIKAVVEGKADSFEFLPRNQQVDLGTYWLVLARRFAGRDNGPQLLNRLYDIGRQMGQVREGDNDIMDVLERVHTERPYFDFAQEGLDDFGVVRWLGKKLAQQADRTFRVINRNPTASDIEVRPGDTIPYRVTLSAEAKLSNGRDVVSEQVWTAFLARCQKRTEAHKLAERTGLWRFGD